MQSRIARDLGNRRRQAARPAQRRDHAPEAVRGNNALIVQRGKGDSGSIAQNGNYNSYGLFQFGRRNSGDVVPDREWPSRPDLSGKLVKWTEVRGCFCC